MSTFPTSLDNLSESHADGTAEIIHASTINDLASAVNAIEAVTQFSLGGIQYRDVQLNDAQIKALPTADVLLVPPPGAGLQIVPLFALYLLDSRAGAYGNVSGLVGNQPGATIYLVTDIGNADEKITLGAACDSGLLSTGLTQWIDQPFGIETYATGNPVFAFATQGQIVAENQAIYVEMANAGALTGGDPANTLSIRTWFATVPAVPFGA